MVELYLTRHGLTVENADGILQGHLPGHLSPEGIEQARLLSEQLGDVPFDLLLTSDLRRAFDTANILNASRHLRVVVTPLLRERDWGQLTGTRIRELRLRPDQFPASVESPQHLQQRARLFLHYLLKNWDNRRLLAVGHGYFDRCIQAEVEECTPHDVPRWGNAEVRVLRIHHEGLHLSVERDATDELADN